MNSLTVEQKENQLVVDSRLVAEDLGIKHKNLIETIRKHKETIESSFGPLSFNKATVTNSVGAVNSVTFCWLTENQVKFILSKSRHGLSKESIDYLKKLGLDFSNYLKTNLPRKKKKESDYSKGLASKLNGKREISTLAGNIDVLTTSQIIEVKPVRMWKHALGQVLVYSNYYPSHQKRIHLYGETQDSFLEMIKSNCSKFDVIVTWEQ